MADKHPDGRDPASGRAMLMLPSASSSETVPSRSTELQPYSLGRTLSSSNQSSVMVPVRLDVLLFLLNSAARGAQPALPPVTIQGGLEHPSACHHVPATQHVPSCCSCTSACHGVYQPSGTHQHGGNYSSRVGVAENRDSRHGRDVGGYQNEGQGWPAASSGGGWRTSQPPMRWQGKPRGEGRGHGSRGNWQGRWQNNDRSSSDRKYSVGDPSPWKSDSRDWRKEWSTYTSSYTNNKRAHEGCPQPPRDGPDAKRPTDNSRAGWLKGQEKKESSSFLGKPAVDGPSKPAVQEDGEDWETDYEKGQTSSAAPEASSGPSHSNAPSNPSKEKGCASSGDPPKPRPFIPPLPELVSKALVVAAAAAKPAEAPNTNQSKNSRFVSYLNNLYSDLPKKSGSEDSSELVIDTDVESSKQDEGEQSLKNEAGGE